MFPEVRSHNNTPPCSQGSFDVAGYEGVGLFPLGKIKSKKAAQPLPMKYSEGLEKPENEIIFVTGDVRALVSCLLIPSVNLV